MVISLCSLGITRRSLKCLSGELWEESQVKWLCLWKWVKKFPSSSYSFHIIKIDISEYILKGLYNYFFSLWKSSNSLVYSLKSWIRKWHNLEDAFYSKKLYQFLVLKKQSGIKTGFAMSTPFQLKTFKPFPIYVCPCIMLNKIKLSSHNTLSLSSKTYPG